MHSSKIIATIEVPRPISFARASELVEKQASARLQPSMQVSLAEAQKRVLAEDCLTPMDQPPFANAAMDGIAVHGDALADGACSLNVLNTVLAGHASAQVVPAGACVRITTGAPMPQGTDTVIVREVLDFANGKVAIPAGQHAAANVRQAGESMRKGDTALRAGILLQARHLALLASLGMSSVPVYRAPRVSLFSTGDELLPVGGAWQAGHIYDSNSSMLAAQSRAAMCQLVRVGHIADDPGRLLDTLREAARDSDLIVTAGGVSMGEADYLPGLLQQHGRIHFWRVQMKPGLPVLFGEINKCLLFALPGNPVSAAVGFHVLVRRALAAMQSIKPGRRGHARLRRAIGKRHARAEFIRCSLTCDDAATLWLEPVTQQGSAQLPGLVEADVLAMIPADMQNPAAGSVLEIWPLDGFLL